MFPKFSNLDASSEEKPNDFAKGALWVWKEPVEGQEYIIGVDSAEGIGSDGDNSCIQVINANTLEQCAEFYSNLISPHDLAQVVNELGLYYNNALVAVEDMSTGGIVLNNLTDYDNLYISAKNNRLMKPGIKINVSNRIIILQELQSRIVNKSLKIKSKRLVREIKTFEYNVQTKKAQAVKGKHDDAIMSIAIANYVRDEIYKGVPIGYESGETKPQISDIRRELREGLKSEVKGIFDAQKTDRINAEKEELLGLYRKSHNLIKEFGW
jgi:hypothetical protein